MPQVAGTTPNVPGHPRVRSPAGFPLPLSEPRLPLPWARVGTVRQRARKATKPTCSPTTCRSRHGTAMPSPLPSAGCNTNVPALPTMATTSYSSKAVIGILVRAVVASSHALAAGASRALTVGG